VSLALFVRLLFLRRLLVFFTFFVFKDIFSRLGGSPDQVFAEPADSGIFFLDDLAQTLDGV